MTEEQEPAPSATMDRIERFNGSTGAPWTLYEAVAKGHSPTSDLVLELTREIVALRTAGVPAAGKAWRRVIGGGAPYSAAEREVVRAFVKPSFGLPDLQQPPGHVEAVIAEHLWYSVMRKDTVDPAVRIEPPKHYVNSPGPDGLSIHRRSVGLAFRLWEIKKHTGVAGLSRTLADAYKQLDAQALQYLAQYSATSVTIEGELADTYARLVDAWRLGEPSAGAGVSVTAKTVPRAAFRAMSKHFTHLRAADSRRGQLLAISDFPGFAQRVLEVLWTGL